jgi:hypothetical protein
MCMKIYSEYLHINKFQYHVKNVCEMVWLAAMKPLIINGCTINLKQSEIIQLIQDIQNLEHAHTHSCIPTHTHTYLCTPLTAHRRQHSFIPNFQPHSYLTQPILYMTP